MENISKIETENSEDDITTQERERIRQEISHMSFEELQKLKQKIGTKIYNKTMFGPISKQPTNSFKRANKNRPREMSSKKRVNLRKEMVQVKKQAFRDPRFDPLCGTFDEDSFMENYKFIYEMRKKEYEQLEKQFQNAVDVEERKKIKFVLQRLGNQIREHEKRGKEKIKLRQEKSEIKNKLKKGEKPIFKKKSERKLENLVEKYEELKKSNKLQKHIEKRSKKLVSKYKKQS